MVGKTLGHYEILEPLGKGGMGEVWRARDTKLDRDVAIKVLPEDFATDPDRLARLEREAKLLAALNHPNIATVHALEGEQGARFLVLELVKGESLEQKLATGPLAVEKALDVCKQIAEALEAAHGEGIIHRDLKPANVLVTPDGRAKVLDFGIAKSLQVDADVAATAQATNLTVAGTLVGTPSYMSPEQVRGGVIGKQVDIWAFGCLLFETLTGRSAFGRETLADTLAAIVDQEPEWERLPELTPTGVRVLLRRCLQKETGSRLHDMADVRIELEDAASEPSAVGAATARTTPQGRSLLPWVAAGLMAVLAAAAMWTAWQSAPAELPSLRASLILPPDHVQPILHHSLALSPDGTQLVYWVDNDGRPRPLYLRNMSSGESTPIPGTEGGWHPFWSPDGLWVGFLADGKLKKVRPGGGAAPIDICDWPGEPRGASWGVNDTIVFANHSTGLMRVSAEGGTLEIFTTPDPEKGERSHRWPDMLPDGKGVLFSIVVSAKFDESRIAVVSLETGEITDLPITASAARYVPTGHLISARDDTLHAVLFDPDTLETTGGEVPMQTGVNVASAGPGSANFTFSRNGRLVYFPRTSTDRRLVLVDLQGNVEDLAAEPLSYRVARFTPPDGDRLFVVVGGDTAGRFEIRVWELEQKRLGTLPLRFENPAAGFHGGIALSGDGKNLAINVSIPGESLDLYSVSLDGSGVAEKLNEALGHKYPDTWSADGLSLLYQEQLAEGGSDIYAVSLETKLSRVVVEAPRYQGEAIESYDGLLTAYSSTESERREVYVVADTPELRQQVSTEGGSAPLWAPNGRTLYFVSGNWMMAAEITTTPLRVGTPSPLFELVHYSAAGGLSRGHDLSPDGEKFVMILDLSVPKMNELKIVAHWFEELKRLVPTGGSR